MPRPRQTCRTPLQNLAAEPGQAQPRTNSHGRCARTSRLVAQARALARSGPSWRRCCRPRSPAGARARPACEGCSTACSICSAPAASGGCAASLPVATCPRCLPCAASRSAENLPGVERAPVQGAAHDPNGSTAATAGVWWTCEPRVVQRSWWSLHGGSPVTSSYLGLASSPGGSTQTCLRSGSGERPGSSTSFTISAWLSAGIRCGLRTARCWRGAPSSLVV